MAAPGPASPAAIEPPADMTRWQRFLFAIRRLLVRLIGFIDRRLGI